MKKATPHTHAHIRGDATDVSVHAALFSDELFQVGLAQLGIVKEGGIGVDVRVDSLVDDSTRWMHLVVVTVITSKLGLDKKGAFDGFGPYQYKKTIFILSIKLKVALVWNIPKELG